VTLQFSTAAQTTASTGSRARYALAIRIGPPEVTSAISSAVEERGHPLVELAQALALRVPVVGPEPGRARDGAELGRHLGGDPALVHAEAPLAERGAHADVDPEPSRERLRSLERPAEVARPELADRLGGKPLGEGQRLLAARGREWRVAVPLDAAVAIPVGLAVADEVEPRHGHAGYLLDM
jgi:hypothetical protein